MPMRDTAVWQLTSDNANQIESARRDSHRGMMSLSMSFQTSALLA